ncbi:MAG TPA: Lpg1974 family pore-forming outer membrane protein [Rhizomicrobium sp.]
MSELNNKNDAHTSIRWKLLMGASVLALTAYVSASGMAKAEESDHPLIWIELGGQLAWNANGQENFLPPFAFTTPRPPFETTPPEKAEKQAPASWDGDAKVSFQPEDNNWVLSAQVRYGKSGRHDYLSQLTQHTYDSRAWAFQNITASSSQQHAIVDFQAGRDFGLGMGASSIVSLGIRFAQFNSRAHAFFDSRPQNFNYYFGAYTRFNANFDAKRSFSGVGPSLSWDGTAALAGNVSEGQIDIDWGSNAALLFGRQSVRGLHKTTTVVYPNAYPSPPVHNSVPLNRSKQVIVPNLGGFAGLSWRLPNAKVAVGYRADFFFGAMDGGIDAAKKENVDFYGPFASVSVGIGG